jgi:hypothetical protein
MDSSLPAVQQKRILVTRGSRSSIGHAQAVKDSEKETIAVDVMLGTIREDRGIE